MANRKRAAQLRLIENALADFQEAIDAIRPLADKAKVRRWDKASDVLDDFLYKVKQADA